MIHQDQPLDMAGESGTQDPENVNGRSGQRDVADFLQERMLPGETRRAYAGRIGIHEATLTELMVRRRTPNTRTLISLLSYFGDGLRAFLGLPVEDQAVGVLGDRDDTSGSVGAASGPAAFKAAVLRALERTGLTLRGAAKESGNSLTTVYSWFNGKGMPFRDNLGRFAEVLGDPGLVYLIESQHRWLRMTCRVCGDVREEKPGLVRAYEKKRDSDRIEVDWNSGGVDYICGKHAGKYKASKRDQPIMKRRGRQALRDRAKPLAAWRETNPETHAEQSRANVAKAREALLLLDGADLARVRLGKLTLKPEGTFSLCAYCHRLIFTTATETRQRQARGAQEVVRKFHVACLKTWRRSEACRAWRLACGKALRSGASIPPMPMPPPSDEGVISGKKLAEYYLTTVRYFRQLHRSSWAVFGEDGQPRSIGWLARDLGKSRKTVYLRVERFVSLLPDGATATGRVKEWRDIFLPLWHDRPGDDPSETTQVAQT